MDSFFPGIVLPADTWNIFINYTGQLKAEGNPQWVNFTCISDDYMSQCLFQGTKCIDLDFSQINNFTVLLNNNKKMHVPAKDFLKNDRRLVNKTIEWNDCNLMIYSRNDH